MFFEWLCNFAGSCFKKSAIDDDNINPINIGVDVDVRIGSTDSEGFSSFVGGDGIR